MKTALSTYCTSLSLALAIAVSSGCASAPKKHSSNEYLMASVLYMQTAAEYRALSYQAYNWARKVLDQDLKEKKNTGLPRAVVVDIDETILDNSPYQAAAIKKDLVFPAGWEEWVSMARAEAIPGALDFLKYADAHGAHVFYITNRSVAEREGTLKNLKAAGFPMHSDSDLMVKTDVSSKEARRLVVRGGYRVVLLMGDNLTDFSSLFDTHRDVAGRYASVDQVRSLWGTEFIVLPNAMYGDWEQALYDFAHHLTNSERQALRQRWLHGF